MLIAVCDNCIKDSEILQSYIFRYGYHNSMNIKVHLHQSIFSMKNALKRYCYDAIFLNVGMEGYEGKRLAEEIFQDYKGKLIFVTELQDYAVEAFRLYAVNYLLKPVHYLKICDCFARLSISHSKACIQVRCGYHKISIPIKAIEYIESFNNKIIIHTENQEFSTYENLGMFYQKLKTAGFIQPYRSYVVNMSYIKVLEKDRILLKNGKEIQVSRYRKQEVMERYNGFIFEISKI